MMITFCLPGECFIMALNTNDGLLTLYIEILIIPGETARFFYFIYPLRCLYSGTGRADIITGIYQGFVIIS